MRAVREAKGKDASGRGAWGRPDPWQKAVYAFETGWIDWNWNTLNIRQVKAGVRRACKLYGLKAPRVKMHRGRGTSYCLSDGSLISFRKDHMNAAMAMHEVAHYIAFRLFGDTPEDHGIAFQGVYFWLLLQAGIAPPCALRSAARHYGLKWRTLPPDMVKDLQRPYQSV